MTQKRPLSCPTTRVPEAAPSCGAIQLRGLLWDVGIRTDAERRFQLNFDIDEDTGCAVWSGGRRGGYGRFWDGERGVVAHRFAWEYLVGPIPDDLQVLHHCDNPPCVNLVHLFLGTQADNMADMASKGRKHRPLGELHGLSKLTEENVREIHASPDTIAQLAEKFGVSWATVQRVRLGRGWTHVRRGS